MRVKRVHLGRREREEALCRLCRVMGACGMTPTLAIIAYKASYDGALPFVTVDFIMLGLSLVFFGGQLVFARRVARWSVAFDERWSIDHRVEGVKAQIGNAAVLVSGALCIACGIAVLVMEVRVGITGGIASALIVCLILSAAGAACIVLKVKALVNERKKRARSQGPS